MRNLKLLNATAVNGNSTKDVSCFAVAVELGITFTATSEDLFAVQSQSGEVLATVSISCGEKCTPISLDYVFDQQAVCLATSDGRLCLWQYDLSPELEVVSEVTQGITDVSWSPDFELLLVATGDGNLLLMTSEFDLITEMTMFPSHQGEDCNVAVGWGKKETQFHGSAGKQAARTEQVEIHPANERDNGKPVISWRGDGQFFAISVIEPDTGARFIYTWSRECVFQARSEAVNGLQHSLGWKPSGSLIASVQTNSHTNTQNVVFFEKNGLRHGEFKIHPAAGKDMFVRQIMWNQDSSILALHIDDHEASGKLGTSYIQLWTVNNYHWYLKQTLELVDGVASACWDPEQAYTMHVVTRRGSLLTCSWAWTTHHTSGSTCEDLSVVAVIDGDKLLVTPLRRMLVPAPMAAFTLQCPALVNQIAFSYKSGSNDFVAFLSTGEIAMFEFDDTNGSPSVSSDGFKSCCSPPVLKYTLKVSGIEVPWTTLSHLLWVSEKSVVIVGQGETAMSSLIYVGDILPEDRVVAFNHTIPVSSVVLSTALNVDTRSIAVELSNGDVLKFTPATKTLTPWMTNQGESVTFPSPCSRTAVTQVGQEEAVLGLTERFRFFVNNTEVASNCTSFAVHNEFLLLTTLSHTLRCLPKHINPANLPNLSPEKAHVFDESSRRVERGSRIVTVVGDGTKVVLQMPRGNLETIHPRALLINSLKRLMDSDQIHEAFVTIWKHRINMNLLYDHNPKHFLANVEGFIKAVNNQNYLNVFLTELIEEDVTQTMYSASYCRESNTEMPDTTSKVDTICDAFLTAFQTLGIEEHIQSVLTAYAKKTKPELEKALLLVWSLHGKEGKSAESALNYLLFLVDVNALYDVALGTYNFDLVMMVAQKSQKDPKEYIPFLNQLRRLEENYRYYSIDKHLKKYSKALEHISKCGDDHFEECLNLVSEHKLHGEALRKYKPGTAQFKRLAVLYGEYLLTKNRHEEAGLQFVRAEEWESALAAFRRANEWQQMFCVAHQLEFSDLQLSDLASKVAGELKGRQKHKEAAIMLIEYSKDYEEAIASLIEGFHWKDALRQIHRYKRADLIETHFLPAVEESWEHQVEMLTSQRDMFLRYKERLLTVRAQKKKAMEEMLEGAADFNDAEADLFSDTTSLTGASVSSRVTSNSSRSTVFTKGSRTRRKAENKKWSLKEGSVYEEFALVDAEAKIIKAVDSLKEDIRELLKVLVQFNFDEKAVELQELYNSLLHLLQSAIPEIWIYTQQSTDTSMSLGPNMTANSVASAMQRGQTLQSEEVKLDPVLLAPPKLDRDTRWKLHTPTDTAEK